VTETHDLFLFRERVLNVIFNANDVVNLEQDFHDGSVCAALQWPERPRRRSHRAVHIGGSSCHDAL
jgi:hypothetical protein